MKKVAFFTLLISAILFPIGVEAGNIVNGIDMDQAGGSGSSQWTGTTTITPTTATSTAAGYTSNVTTGVFQFGTQASEGMRYSPVTGGGRLGIGTTAPAYGVDYTGTTSLRSDVPFTAGDTPTALNFALGDGDTGFYEYADDTMVIAVGGTGRVICAADNTSALRSFVGNGFGLANETASATNPTLLPYFTNTSSGIGGDADNKIYVITSGATAMTYSDAVGGPAIIVPGLAGAGALQADGSGQIIALSDESIKDLIEPIKATLDDVAKLQGYRYTWKVGSGVNTGYEKDFPEVGFTAQSVQAAFPDLVNTKRIEQKRRVIGVDDKAEPIYEEYKELTDVPKLNYSTRGLVAYLVEALKDANNRIKALEANQANILNRLEKLEAK